MKKIIRSPHSPAAIGPYNQAVSHGEYIFCSGQLPLDPKTSQMVGKTAAEQTQQVMKNLKVLLEAAGSDLSKVLKCTLYIKHWNDFEAINTVYSSFFPKDPPARACVEVSGLPKSALIEIECMAHQ